MPGPSPTARLPGGLAGGTTRFVGVGAQKAGTSWWNALICLHPAVHRAGGQPKELHYFDRAWEDGFSEADRLRYWRYFPRPEGGVSGEWTPGYLIDFWTPELLARAAPDTRVLILLRDPLERFRSGLTHQLATSTARLEHRDIQGAFAAVSTPRSCAACWRRSPPDGSTSASTRPAARTRPASWLGRTRSSTSRRSTLARMRSPSEHNP